MKHRQAFAALCVATGLVAAPGALKAHEGHDHGAAPPAVSGPVLPRFSAVSESFELVGVLSGRQLTLYLDRYADNTPGPDARIELEIGGAKFVADKTSDAAYEVTLKDAPASGVLPVTATISAGNETDLLAGELELAGTAPAEAAAPARSWKAWAGSAAGGLAGVLLMAFAVRRLQSVRNRSAA